jgi:protein XRP2
VSVFLSYNFFLHWYILLSYIMGNLCARKADDCVENNETSIEISESFDSGSDVSSDSEIEIEFVDGDAPPRKGSSDGKNNESQPKAVPSPVFQPKPAPKAEDYMLMNLEGELIVREPGTIDGQQFIIDGCKYCDIFLLDHSAQITVDNCENCRIFVGPCEGSIYIRTTKNSNFVVAAQQLRFRECSKLDVLAFISAGQPSIEDCTDIHFGCFQFSYFGMKDHFAKANLQVWDNDWFNVHDFTPGATPNYKMLPPNTTYHDLLKKVANASATISDEEAKASICVPQTLGPIDADENADTDVSERVFVAIAAPDASNRAYDLLQTIRQANRDHVRLYRTRQAKLAGAEFANAETFLETASKDNIVGLLFAGKGSRAHIAAACYQLIGMEQQNDSVFPFPDNDKLFIVDAAEEADVVEQFFAPRS